jgi:hypothetical protein
VASVVTVPRGGVRRHERASGEAFVAPHREQQRWVAMGRWLWHVCGRMDAIKRVVASPGPPERPQDAAMLLGLGLTALVAGMARGAHTLRSDAPECGS